MELNRSFEMSNTLPHTGDSYPGTSGANPAQLFSSSSLALILHLQRNTLSRPGQGERCGLAAEWR